MADPTDPDPAAFDLGAFLPYRLATAAARVSRGFAERYGRTFGLSIPEWRVMAHLAGGQALSVRDVHARVDLDKPAVTRAAQRLEAARLLARAIDPADRRLVRLSLTPAGVELMARLVPLALDYQREVLAALGPAAAGLRLGLDRLLEER